MKRYLQGIVNSNVEEMPANAPAVIPVKTGMTGVHKRLSLEKMDRRVKILAQRGVGKFCR